jgi:hypothetical protein
VVRPKILADGRKCDLYLEAAQWAECERRARARGLSTSEYLRLLIDFALGAEDQHRRRESRE